MIDVTIKEMAKKLSDKFPTPFYLMDLDAIQERFLSFEGAWKKEFKNFKVAYSYKTNALKAIVQLLQKNGSCAEVVSWAEAQWALSDGHKAADIFFDGPFKSKEEIRQAVFAGARIQLDSLDEINDVVAVFNETGRNTRVSMRLSTDYRGKKVSRFGFSSSEAAIGFAILKKNGISLSGLHLHVGSNEIFQNVVDGEIMKQQPRDVFHEVS